MDQSNNRVSILNDYEDIRITLYLGNKSPDDWLSYYCSFFLKDYSSGQFKEVYSSVSGSINTEAQLGEFQDLRNLLQKVLREKNSTCSFVTGSGDFSLRIESKEDLFRVTAGVDLSSMNKERLEAGSGDSELSLSFNCSPVQIENFAGELDRYLDLDSGT